MIIDPLNDGLGEIQAKIDAAHAAFPGYVKLTTPLLQPYQMKAFYPMTPEGMAEELARLRAERIVVTTAETPNLIWPVVAVRDEPPVTLDLANSYVKHAKFVGPNSCATEWPAPRGHTQRGREPFLKFMRHRR